MRNWCKPIMVLAAAAMLSACGKSFEAGERVVLEVPDEETIKRTAYVTATVIEQGDDRVLVTIDEVELLDVPDTQRRARRPRNDLIESWRVGKDVYAPLDWTHNYADGKSRKANTELALKSSWDAWGAVADGDDGARAKIEAARADVEPLGIPELSAAVQLLDVIEKSGGFEVGAGTKPETVAAAMIAVYDAAAEKLPAVGSVSFDDRGYGLNGDRIDARTAGIYLRHFDDFAEADDWVDAHPDAPATARDGLARLYAAETRFREAIGAATKSEPTARATAAVVAHLSNEEMNSKAYEDLRSYAALEEAVNASREKLKAAQTALGTVIPSDEAVDRRRVSIKRDDNMAFLEAFEQAQRFSSSNPQRAKRYLKTYIEAYPDGLHVEDAKTALEKVEADFAKQEAARLAREDDEYFERVKNAATSYGGTDDSKLKSGLEEYLEQHPQGRHVTEAKATIARLEKKRRDHVLKLAAKTREYLAGNDRVTCGHDGVAYNIHCDLIINAVQEDGTFSGYVDYTAAIDYEYAERRVRNAVTGVVKPDFDNGRVLVAMTETEELKREGLENEVNGRWRWDLSLDEVERRIAGNASTEDERQVDAYIRW